jgi:hypothetical protein
MELVANKIHAAGVKGVTPYLHNYSTGGIFGFDFSGSAFKVVGDMEAVVAEIKAAAKEVSIESLKTKVII